MGQHGRHDTGAGSIDDGSGFLAIAAHMGNRGLAQLLAIEARTHPFLAHLGQISRLYRIESQVAGADSDFVHPLSRDEIRGYPARLSESTDLVGGSPKQRPSGVAYARVKRVAKPVRAHSLLSILIVTHLR